MRALDVAEKLEPFGLDPDERGRRDDENIENGVAAAAPEEADRLLDMQRSRGPSRATTSGEGDRTPARWRKNPKALAASAAEDSGLSNSPLSISLPGAPRKILSISAPGTPGSHLSDLSVIAVFAVSAPMKPPANAIRRGKTI